MSSSSDNMPVHVTGEERRHPSIRQLARACIALARLRLEQQAEAEHRAKADDAPADLAVPQSGSAGEEDTRRG